jgi:Xaa-Pro aminopeptidase
VSEIDAAVRAVFTTGLPALGLASSSATGTELDAEIALWFPHGPTHGIGMDVHESLDTLVPGTAFVIEPGLYIHAGAFDRLPKTPETGALAARLGPAVDRFRDIGIRIEDSFLMTPSGPLMLSAKAPRRATDIERIVGKGR